MKYGRILIVDDDEAIRMVLTEALERQGHKVTAAANLAELAAHLESFSPDVLITDVMLPDGNGLDIVPQILAKRPNLPIIVLSAQNTLSTAVRATEQGAFEYLPKPFDLDELCRAVNDGLRRRAIVHNDALDPSEEAGLPLIGRSPAMQDVYRTIARVVQNDLSVLILGESGTGKELVARAIHDLGARKSRPFIAVNMAAIPRELIEAELFGHERGAFTGAAARVAGRFEQAAGGTLFLDEIGDMPIEAQTRLLRVLQANEFTTVGGHRTIKADVRIVAATHKHLPDLINDGSFREDLYYRLNVIPISLPALRQRGDDVALLARHFLDEAASQGLPHKRLDGSGKARLLAYDWPGNVRELENLMRRLAVLARDDIISATLVDEQLSQSKAAPNASAPTQFAEDNLSVAVVHYLNQYFALHGDALPPDGLYDRLIEILERPLLEAAMRAARGNQIRAAKLLGMNRNTIRKKLGELSIEPSHGRITKALN
jgi:two-component system, NtrC family, nitrogen regulation response regulator GlnG